MDVQPIMVSDDLAKTMDFFAALKVHPVCQTIREHGDIQIQKNSQEKMPHWVVFLVAEKWPPEVLAEVNQFITEWKKQNETT